LASIKDIASSIGRNETSFLGGRGPLTSRATFRSSTPRRTRNRNQLRTAASFRTIVVASSERA
jgi:hypothetical protein